MAKDVWQHIHKQIKKSNETNKIKFYYEDVIQLIKK